MMWTYQLVVTETHSSVVEGLDARSEAGLV